MEDGALTPPGVAPVLVEGGVCDRAGVVQHPVEVDLRPALPELLEVIVVLDRLESDVGTQELVEPAVLQDRVDPLLDHGAEGRVGDGALEPVEDLDQRVFGGRGDVRGVVRVEGFVRAERRRSSFSPKARSDLRAVLLSRASQIFRPPPLLRPGDHQLVVELEALGLVDQSPRSRMSRTIGELGSMKPAGSRSARSGPGGSGPAASCRARRGRSRGGG